MIKKTLKYKNYAGEEITDDFYFNIDESELIMMNWSERGGLDKYYEKIIKEEDNRKILAAFKELIDLSYGVRSLDGKFFEKTEANLNRFKSSGAYNQLLLELFTQNDAGENNFAEQFANGLLPADLIERVRKAEAEEKANQPSLPQNSGTFQQPSFDEQSNNKPNLQ